MRISSFQSTHYIAKAPDDYVKEKRPTTGRAQTVVKQAA